jgi:hypothetical protein
LLGDFHGVVMLNFRVSQQQQQQQQQQLIRIVQNVVLLSWWVQLLWALSGWQQQCSK